MGDPESPSDLRQFLFVVPRGFTTLIFVDSRSSKRCEMWWMRPHAQIYRIPKKIIYAATVYPSLPLLLCSATFRNGFRFVKHP